MRNLERGQAAMTLPALLHLSLALGDLIGRPLTLAELFGGAQTLALDADHRTEVTSAWLERMLSGDPVALTPGDTPLVADYLSSLNGQHPNSEPLTEQEHSDALNELIEQSKIPPNHEVDHDFAPTPPSLAEKRAAQKLGIRPDELQQWADELWGCPLEAESARRSGPEATPQARGRVTRKLVDEIRSAFMGREGGL